VVLLGSAGAGAGEVTGEPADEYPGDQGTGEERARVAPGEPTYLLDHLTRLPVLQPVRRLVRPTGRLVDQLAGQAALLAVAGHRVQLRTEGAQPFGGPLLLHARLVGQLAGGLVDQVPGLGTGFPYHLPALLHGRLRDPAPACAAPCPTPAACSRTAGVVDSRSVWYGPAP